MQTILRRIVTGHTASGKSAILIEDELQPDPGVHDRYLWKTDATPALNEGSADAALAPLRLEPPVNGSVFRVVEFPPQRVMDGMDAKQKDAFFRELYKSMGGEHCRVDTERSPGMHKTSTVDYVIVLRGEITLLLDEGEATLESGDIVIQRGTNHDWVVRGDAPALLAVVMISAAPV